MDIRLITYNVHCFPWITTPIKEIVTWIVRNGDVAALQEVWYRHTEWAAAFAAHGWIFLKPAREAHFATVFGSGLAIVMPGSWQVQDARFYPFLRSAGLDSLVAKGWFRVDLRDPRGRPLRIINTHMQANLDLVGHLCPDYTEKIRKAQARQITDSVSGPTMTIVVGDMNTGENLFKGFSLIHGTDLDHCAIPVGGPWSVSARVDSEADGWSDHLPVVYSLL